MALGNNNSMSKVRGKNKPMQIKRSKEYATAANYTAFQGSAVQATHPSGACGVHPSSINITYYHDGSHSSGFPLVNGDKIYTIKRANTAFSIADGMIKIGPDSKARFYSIQISGGENDGGAAAC